MHDDSVEECISSFFKMNDICGKPLAEPTVETCATRRNGRRFRKVGLLLSMDSMNSICEIAFEADDKWCFQCLDSLVEFRFNHDFAKRYMERMGFRYCDNVKFALVVEDGGKEPMDNGEVEEQTGADDVTDDGDEGGGGDEASSFGLFE